MDAKFKLNTNVKKKINGFVDEAQFVLDEMVLKDSNNFIPWREGYLENSGTEHSLIGQGLIKWTTPYARKWYYNTPKNGFSKNKNPNARKLWFEEAKALHSSDWLQALENLKNQMI